MKFTAAISIMPLKEILDPQGKVVTNSIKNLGLQEIQNVRVGKHITLEIEAQNRVLAQEKVDQACKQLLANPIMESYTFELQDAIKSS